MQKIQRKRLDLHQDIGERTLIINEVKEFCEIKFQSKTKTHNNKFLLNNLLDLSFYLLKGYKSSISYTVYLIVRFMKTKL